MIGNLNQTATELLIQLVYKVKAGEIPEQFQVRSFHAGDFIMEGIDTTGARVNKHQLQILAQNAYLSADSTDVFSITGKAYRDVEAYHAGAPTSVEQEIQSQTGNPPQIITINGPVGALQTGPNSTANVTQNINANSAEIVRLLEQLKSNLSELPDEKQEDASDILETLQEEVESSEPDARKISRSFKMLQRASRGIGKTTQWGANLTILITKLEELGIPIEQLPNLFQ